MSTWISLNKIPHSYSARQIGAGVLVFVMLIFIIFCLIELYIASHKREIAKSLHQHGGKTTTLASEDFGPNVHYGIVIDCGSSGSRIFVYFWPPHSGNPQDLLNIQQLMDKDGKPVVKKITPGLY